MPNLPQTEMGLKTLRADTLETLLAARAKGNQEAEKAAKTLLGEIDDALDDLAFGKLGELASELSKIRKTLEAATRTAQAWPFGNSDAPADHERAIRPPLQDNDLEDQGPDADPPAPAPVGPGTIPQVSPGWANAYQALWTTMIVSPEWKKTATAIAGKIIGMQGRYASAVAGTSIPWWFVAVVHAMECSLRFDEHLHNGDPLTAQTVRIPPGRPPFRFPPPAFTWEESARDALAYERIDKVTDWSLTSTLYHWHRYNGMNNEYKRRGIPTPYLWSGCQHYRKGKYVSDGNFDPEAVSKQVGAAVLLKTLIDLKAVFLKDTNSIENNPATANQHLESLEINTDGTAFRHVDAELAFPGDLAKGMGATSAVRRVQEWLNFHDLVTPIDGNFGEATAAQLARFQTRAGRSPSGELDSETWSLLTAPMRRALSTIVVDSSTTIEGAILKAARQHIAQFPAEIGGNNRGPWVRLYMQGREGTDQKWCAGFVSFMAAQAARDLGTKLPFKRHAGVDQLVADARTSGRFVTEKSVSNSVLRRSLLRPGDIFVVRASADDWTHTGIVLQLNDTTFDTIEGNTGGDGGTDGANARQGNRSYANKDFLKAVSHG